MLRILSILVCLLLIQNYSFAENAPTTPPLPTPSKEAPPISNVLDNKEQGPVANAPANQKIPASAKQSVDQHKAVIEEYKQYLAKVPAEVREEIREYRKEVIKLNRRKISLYKKLSQEAQEFLNTERNFKKRLPFRERKKIHPQPKPQG